MSEVTASQPALAPPTMEEAVAAETAALIAATAEMAALRRALDAAKLSPGRVLSDNALIIATSRLADYELVALAVHEHIRDAAKWRTVMELHEAAQAALAPVPEPAPARTRRGKRTAGAHRRLTAVQAVKGFVPVAAFGAALKAARPALKPAAAALAHPVRHLLAASLPVKLTALPVKLTAAAAAGLTVAGVVAAVPNATLTHPFGAPAPAQASVPGWYGSADPIPGAWQIIAGMSRPSVEPGLDGKSGGASGATGASVPGGLEPVPPAYGDGAPPSHGDGGTWSPVPSQQAPQQQAPQQQQSQAGPAVLSVTLDSGLDLSAVPAVTLTISASGIGWAHWRVDAGGTDLTFSATHGVLQAGETATLTVTADPPTDGLTMQTFTVAGQQYTVTLPLPLPVPVVSPSPLPSLPTAPPSSSGD